VYFGLALASLRIFFVLWKCLGYTMDMLLWVRSGFASYFLRPFLGFAVHFARICFGFASDLLWICLGFTWDLFGICFKLLIVRV
jgi:hypothetical protein